MKSEWMQRIRQEYEEEIKRDPEQAAADGTAIKKYLDDSAVAYNGLVPYTLHIPKIYTRKEIDYFQWIVATTYRIVTKAIKEYLENPEYRKEFPFSKELEGLIRIPNLYDSLLPMARFDIFFREDNWDFTFCEINTDGTSAMLEDYVLNQSLALNHVHQKLLEKYPMKSFELFDRWVEKMLALYETYEKKVKHPYIVIADYMQHCNIHEFQEFADSIQKAGCEAEICNILDMTYRDGVLYSAKGHPIDLIYRRAVTCDIMSHYEESQAFLQAVRDQNVCVMGAFCTQIPHHKWLFKVLREECSRQFLTDEEWKFVQEHFPYTNVLHEKYAEISQLLREKDRFIIKPMDSYASRGVFAGVDFTDQEWEKIVRENWNRDYIYQEYCAPYRSGNICYRDKDPRFLPYTNMAGLYVYGGELAGIYSRLSTGGIISSQYNERAVATLVADVED